MLNAFARKPSAAAQDHAYSHIKSRILSLLLKPGQWLRAQDIASELGLSRTPVREALSRLEQEGFVCRDEGWGYVVRSVSFREARELYKVREALEAEAAREAVSNICAGELRTLESLLKKAEQAHANRRLADFRHNTRAFHERIAGIAGNTLLARMLSGIEDQVQLLGAMVFDKHDERTAEVVEENREIFNALRQADAALADAAARRHVRRAWGSFVRYVASDEGVAADLKARTSAKDTLKEQGIE